MWKIFKDRKRDILASGRKTIKEIYNSIIKMSDNRIQLDKDDVMDAT